MCVLFYSVNMFSNVFVQIFIPCIHADKSISYMLQLLVPKQVRDCQFLFILLCFCFFVLVHPFHIVPFSWSVSPYLEVVLWLQGKILTLFFNFLIMSMEISWFSWKLSSCIQVQYSAMNIVCWFFQSMCGLCWRQLAKEPEYRLVSPWGQDVRDIQ